MAEADLPDLPEAQAEAKVGAAEKDALRASSIIITELSEESTSTFVSWSLSVLVVCVCVCSVVMLVVITAGVWPPSPSLSLWWS